MFGVCVVCGVGSMGLCSVRSCLLVWCVVFCVWVVFSLLLSFCMVLCVLCVLMGWDRWVSFVFGPGSVVAILSMSEHPNSRMGVLRGGVIAVIDDDVVIEGPILTMDMLCLLFVLRLWGVCGQCGVCLYVLLFCWLFVCFVFFHVLRLVGVVSVF